jgi:hypothetical protein
MVPLLLRLLKSRRAWGVTIAVGLTSTVLWSLTAYPRGMLMAHVDHARGHFELKAYGLPPPWEGEYARLLEEGYGVELNPVAGCVVTEGLVWYVAGYNSVSQRLLIERYRSDIFNLLADERLRQGVEVVERCADTPASGDGYQAVSAVVAQAYRELWEPFDEDLFRGLGGAVRYAAAAVRHLVTWEPLDFGKGPLGPVEDEVAGKAAAAAHMAETGEWRRASPRERSAQSGLLRDLFGNPFRATPVIDPVWLTPTVVSIARRAYDERAFAALPVLGDALEEAGCTGKAILAHCRSGGEHARGCWAVDLLRAKG